MDLEKIIKENQGTIVDVRSYGEFMEAMSILSCALIEIPERIKQIKV
jgi:hypothetical protein